MTLDTNFAFALIASPPQKKMTNPIFSRFELRNAVRPSQQQLSSCFIWFESRKAYPARSLNFKAAIKHNTGHEITERTRTEVQEERIHEGQ